MLSAGIRPSLARDPQVGTGGFATVAEACDATIQVVDRTPVDPQTKAFYDRGYAVYRKLYLDLRDSFRSLSELARG